MNKIAPLSPKQISYYMKSKESWLNVAEGGKRGGKNVLQTLAYCDMLETHPDKLHLIAGVSTTTARLNIADCDGFGIFNFFEGRYRKGKYQNRDCIYVNTKVGQKVILVSGGGKNGDERYIKGNTYGSAYVTEANECSKTFLNEVMDRTMSSSNRKVYLDLNPKAPKHWFYDEFLAYHEKMQSEDETYGYNYGHFTIADNYSISNERLREILKTYNKDTIWYKRDIKGIRCSADGLIYQQFADNPNDYLTDDIDRNDIMRIIVGVDFGGNGSQHSFVATAFTKRLKEVVVLASRIVKAKDTSPRDLEREFVKFMQEQLDRWGLPIAVYCDSAEQVLIKGLKIASLQNRLQVEIHNALKKPINDRIRFVCSLLAQHRIKLLKKYTTTLQSAISTAQWDSEEFDDVRLDDGTSDIDTMDAFEYSMETMMSNYILTNKK